MNIKQKAPFFTRDENDFIYNLNAWKKIVQYVKSRNSYIVQVGFLSLLCYESIFELFQLAKSFNIINYANFKEGIFMGFLSQNAAKKSYLQ